MWRWRWYGNVDGWHEMLDTTEDRRCNNQQLKESYIVLLFIGSSIAIMLAGRVVEEVLLLCGHAGRFGTTTTSFILDAASSRRASVGLLEFLGVLRR